MHLSPVRPQSALSALALSALALTALTAACGSATDSPSPAAFPVTLSRKGGVAGLDQRIVVTQDGRATATGRGAGSACRLEESAKEDLDSLARGVEGTAKTSYEHPDDLVVVVQTSRGSTRLDDLDQPDRAAVVTHLFEDLFGASAERTVCR
jgi:hypothetical protein